MTHNMENDVNKDVFLQFESIYSLNFAHIRF